MLKIPYATKDNKIDRNFMAVSQWSKRVYNQASAAPDSEYHSQGELVYDTSPDAGGYIGWVCVASGTPGTWKRFGQIEA